MPNKDEAKRVQTIFELYLNFTAQVANLGKDDATQVLCRACL